MSVGTTVSAILIVQDLIHFLAERFFLNELKGKFNIIWPDGWIKTVTIVSIFHRIKSRPRRRRQNNGVEEFVIPQERQCYPLSATPTPPQTCLQPFIIIPMRIKFIHINLQKFQHGFCSESVYIQDLISGQIPLD